MSRSRSARFMAVVGALSTAAAVLLYACHNEPTEPVMVEAGIGANKVQLTIQGTGSTRNGLVTSNRGGINCSIIVTSSGVSKSGACVRSFKNGVVVTLTAAPANGAVLARWEGCQPTSDNPLACQVTMDQSRTVTVVFAPPPNSFNLTVSGGANGSGNVQSLPSGITCTISSGAAGSSGCTASFATGTQVRLTATASSGSFLKAWAGAGCDLNGNGTGSGSGVCIVTMSQQQAVVVSFETDAAEAVVGFWSAPISWPAVAIHAHLLPNGKVMTYGRSMHAPVLWDPANPTVFGSAGLPADFFCSGHSLLPDGRLLVAGGHSGFDNQGTKTSYLYDFATNVWTRGPDMQNGRWYPTNTTLANGEALTISGGDTAQVLNAIPEVWQTNGTWRVLSTASRAVAYYPKMFVAPDGRVFMAGPSRASMWLNTSGTGQWATGPQSLFGFRDYGGAVMYDVGKILVVGGGDPPTNTSEVIDLNAGAGATWRYTAGSLHVPRRQTTATLLADGTVLVVGGSNSSGFNTAPTNSAVLAAERWNPATEQWTQLARMTHHRLYHGNALLLPDARVLSVGSGQPAAAGMTDDFTAEIFAPPYLFRVDGTPATRPTITSAPVSVAYGQTFSVGTPDAAGISKVTWIRIASVTHSNNMNQRMNYLTFTRGTSSLSVTAPTSGTRAPPGHYMLFIVNSSGVPSVAKIIRIF
jgi:hypothetical protein